MIGSLSLSALQGVLPATRQGADVSFTRVSTDTRTLRPGDLYVALRGASFDGNAFVDQAFENGACAAIVSSPAAVRPPCLLVADTTAALCVGSMCRPKAAARAKAPL